MKSEAVEMVGPAGCVKVPADQVENKLRAGYTRRAAPKPPKKPPEPAPKGE